MKRRVFLTAVTAIGAGCLHDFGGRSSDGGIDASGEIEITVNGEPIDLTQERLQAENADNSSLAFHFHEGDGLWYMEGERVTFAEGIDLLPYFGYEKGDAGHSLTYDGTTYAESDGGTEVSFSADGEEVEPTEYELRGGESLRIEVETGGDG